MFREVACVVELDRGLAEVGEAVRERRVLARETRELLLMAGRALDVVDLDDVRELALVLGMAHLARDFAQVGSAGIDAVVRLARRPAEDVAIGAIAGHVGRREDGGDPTRRAAVVRGVADRAVAGRMKPACPVVSGPGFDEPKLASRSDEKPRSPPISARTRPRASNPSRPRIPRRLRRGVHGGWDCEQLPSGSGPSLHGPPASAGRRHSKRPFWFLTGAQAEMPPQVPSRFGPAMQGFPHAAPRPHR